ISSLEDSSMIYLRRSSVETPLQIPWMDGSMQCKQNNESMHANRRCYIPERNGFNGKPHNRMEDLDVIQTIRQHQWTLIHLSLHKFIKLILKKISKGIEIKKDALTAVEENIWQENALLRKLKITLNRDLKLDLRNQESIKNNRCNASKHCVNKLKSEPYQTLKMKVILTLMKTIQSKQSPIFQALRSVLHASQ